MILDFRRHVRPFFLTPDGSKPTPYKRYYDIISWLATQIILAFTVLPFVLLSFSDSMTVWSHVYYYGIVGTFSSIAFFASPAKAYLVKQVKRRSSRPHMARSVSNESIPPTTLGLPNDPERDFDEAVQEIKSEIESRRRRGSVVAMPTGEELKIAVEQKIGRKL